MPSASNRVPRAAKAAGSGTGVLWPPLHFAKMTTWLYSGSEQTPCVTPLSVAEDIVDYCRSPLVTVLCHPAPAVPGESQAARCKGCRG